VLGLADLSGGDFSHCRFDRANLVGTNGQGAIFEQATFHYARPGMADFAEANLRGTDLSRAIFRRANLRGADAIGHSGSPNLDGAVTDGARGL
jgi:uncharacterized protein YjbI with pentapeptide repeats